MEVHQQQQQQLQLQQQQSERRGEFSYDVSVVRA